MMDSFILCKSTKIKQNKLLYVVKIFIFDAKHVSLQPDRVVPMNIVIVIPIYKSVLSADEEQSLRQCMRVLGNYKILLVCPEGLDLSAYHMVAGRQLPFESFSSYYFASIDGYNHLLMSPCFYERFSGDDYMLIYQLDAWVFRDELDNWCKQGYDYVGAPWFELNRSHEEGYDLWLVGNGGLSLRRIEKFLTTSSLPSMSKVKTCHQVFRQEYHSFSDLGHCLFRCMGPWVGTNSIRHIRKRYQEDFFFCYGLRGSNYELSTPSPQQAALFAFECSPEYLFNEVTHGQLPFGCHAWRKYQYEEFWKQYIKI